MSTTLPILYSFRRCPYAMRARMSIVRTSYTCEHREVILRDRPDHMMEISPKGTVPVLLLPNGKVIEESLEIMQHVLSWELSTEDLNWVDRNDNEFKFHLDCYPRQCGGSDGTSPTAPSRQLQGLAGLYFYFYLDCDY